MSIYLGNDRFDGTSGGWGRHGGDKGKAAQHILFSLHVACVAQSRDDETEFLQLSFPWWRQRRWGKLLYPSLCLCAYSSMFFLSFSSPMHSLFSHLRPCNNFSDHSSILLINEYQHVVSSSRPRYCLGHRPLFC